MTRSPQAKTVGSQCTERRTDVLIDASVLEYPTTGVAKAMLTLYEGAVRIEPALKIETVHRKPLNKSAPSWAIDTQTSAWCPSRGWRRYVLPRIMAQKRARVVHFPWNTGAVPPPPGTKSLLTVHDVIPLVLPDLYFRTEQERSSFTRRIQASIDASDCILTVSECSKRDILRHLRPRNEPVVIYHSLGPAPPPPMQSVQLRLGPAPFVYLGGFERRKGLDLLISVHSELFASGAVTRKLVLLGQAPSEASQQSPVLLSARRLGAIVEPGYVEDSEVIRWLSTACALVYPSLYEGFGFPLLEAMAHGCPVITTHAGAMPEVCGEAALYVTPGNRRELGAAMVQLSADETARTSLAQRGLTQAATFSWERNSQGLLAILNRLASSHGEFDDHRRL